MKGYKMHYLTCKRLSNDEFDNQSNSGEHVGLIPLGHRLYRLKLFNFEKSWLYGRWTGPYSVAYDQHHSVEREFRFFY